MLTMPDSPAVLARVQEGLEVVEHCARQLRRQCGHHMDLDDLRSAGREALLAAARSFEADRNIPFRRWANLRVRGAMIDAVRANGRLPRRVYRELRAIEAADRVLDASQEETAAAVPAPAGEVADKRLSDDLASAATAMAMSFLARGSSEEIDRAAAPSAGPEDEVARAEVLDIVRRAIAERPDAERQLLQRHYFDDVTLEDAGKELGLSKSWASRLHARAIEGVTKAMKRARTG